MRALFSVLCALTIAASTAHARWYSDTSPWNTPISPNAVTHPLSAEFIANISGHFGSRTDKYTFPVYRINQDTPVQSVWIRGFYSHVTKPDKQEKLQVIRKTRIKIPIPLGAKPAKGKDRHMVFWNPQTGDEWGLWHVRREKGRWKADNGYHYNTRWDAVPPNGFISRGAGVPYLAGLITPSEMRRGVIEHALALGINYPSPNHVYPATKSDGRSRKLHALPMGSRLQLDPSLGDSDFDRWGLDRNARVIARALQRYGMILVDGSGHPKLYGEYDGTANWAGLLAADTISDIPYSAFRVLKPDPPTGN